MGCGQPSGLTQRLSIATGGTGGVYYPYGGGIAKVISDHLDGVEATAEVTAGTVDNLKFIANRSADLGFALADSLDDAYHGRAAFEEFGAIGARQQAVGQLDDADASAEMCVDSAHFQADISASNDQHGLRNVGEFQRAG